MFAAILLFIFISPTLQDSPTCTGLIGCATEKLTGLFGAGRLALPPPKSAEEIGTTMILWTGANSSIPQVIDINNPSNISATDFDPKKNTTMISHGYLGDGYLPWIKEMCQALQTKEPINCFAINWGKGAGINYLQSASNLRTVGTQVANFIKFLTDEKNISIDTITMFGHSLGAHLVGDAGMKCNSQLKLIFGMDPASYLFIGASNKDKLDRSDAKTVVVMHTDEATIVENVELHGFGSTEMNGHIDFIANKGRNQPGCPQSPLVVLTNLNDIIGTAACSHERSHDYLTAAILYLNNSAFNAYPASSIEDFNNGSGFPCNDKCLLVGDFKRQQEVVAANPTKNQLYFFNTGADSPYYRYRCEITLQISANSSTTASLSMTLQKNSKQSESYDLYSGDVPVNSFSKFLDVQFDGPLEAATISFNPKEKISIVINLTIKYGRNSTVYTMSNKEPTQDATIKLSPN